MHPSVDGSSSICSVSASSSGCWKGDQNIASVNRRAPSIQNLLTLSPAYKRLLFHSNKDTDNSCQTGLKRLFPQLPTKQMGCRDNKASWVTVLDKYNSTLTCGVSPRPVIPELPSLTKKKKNKKPKNTLSSDRLLERGSQTGNSIHKILQGFQ